MGEFSPPPPLFLSQFNNIIGICVRLKFENVNYAPEINHANAHASTRLWFYYIITKIHPPISKSWIRACSEHSVKQSLKTRRMFFLHCVASDKASPKYTRLSYLTYPSQLKAEFLCLGSILCT